MVLMVLLGSILAAIIVAIIFYAKCTTSEQCPTPSLFESIHFMKAEIEKEQESQPVPKRYLSQSSRKKSQNNDKRTSVSGHHYFQSVTDLLSNLGITDDTSLHQILASFRPLYFSPGSILNTTLNLLDHVIVVQTGEVQMTFNDGQFDVAKVVKEGGVIHSRIGVLQFLLNAPCRDEVPMLTTIKDSVLLVLPFKAIRNLLSDDAISCSISRFIAQLQKVALDAFYCELAVPLTTMLKARKTFDADTNLPHFLAKQLIVDEEEFLKKRLLKYNLDKGEQITINGATSDIGLVLVTKGSVQVHWSDKDEGDPCYTVKNSWYGFISLLSTPMGTPFPKSVALENDTEIGILTRSAFYDLVLKHPDLLKTAAKKLLKELTPFLLKIFYFFDWTTVKSGSEIFNKGDPENGAFIVIRGRLKRPGHFAEHFDDFFLVGIYDVLLERNHTQSIIAARSTELCHVPSQIIRAIKNRFPTVQHKLVKVLGEQLLESWRSSNETQEEEKSSNQRRKLRVKAIAIFGSTWDAPVQKIISELKNSIAMISVSVIRLSSKRITERTPSNVGSNIDPLANPYLFAWLRDQERGYDILLYQCDSSLTNWTKWCLSEADVVLDLNLASKGPLVKIYENEVFQYAGRHAEIRLVLLHAPETVIPRGTADWLFRRQSSLSNHYHVKMTPNTGSPGTPNIHSDVSRVSRHLLGLDVGLVLGGGGARGAAHVGMLKAIQEAGIPIDRIGGVSIGAFIGGLWATHRDRSSLATLAKEWFLIIHNEWWNHIMDFTYPSTALFSGDFFNWSVKKVVGENIMIEDLWIPYFCCTTDISSQVSKIHRSGRLWRYVRASMSYAWLLPPICDPHDGHLLLDGCYTDNVPGKAMKSTGVKYILVLDVAAVDDRELTNFGDTLSGWWALFNNLNPFGCKVKIPNQTDIQLRLAFCSHYRNLEELKRDPKYEYIHPELGSYTSSDFNRFQPIYEIGYNHATTYLAGMRKLRT